MMDVDFVPEHLIVVGGSYIGLEFAQMYRRFGSAVTIVEMSPRLIQREDADVSQISAILEGEGINIRLSAECVALEERHDQVAVLVERAMHIHPTVSELIPRLLGELKPLE